MKVLTRLCCESHLPLKSEIRSPKSERNPKSEQDRNGGNFRISVFVPPCGISGFEFRISDFVVAASFFLFPCVAAAAENSYPLEVFPPEHRRMTDPKTGAELLFLTTAPEKDSNLYFHERSWLADESMVLFNSSRPEGGLMGYLPAT